MLVYIVIILATNRIVADKFIAGREIEKHELISHGFHCWRYCSWARTYNVVLQDGGHTPGIRLTETCSFCLQRLCMILDIPVMVK